MSKPKNWLVIGRSVAIPLTESVYISQKDFKDALRVESAFGDFSFQIISPAPYDPIAEIISDELIKPLEVKNELETAPQPDAAKADTVDRGPDSIF